MIYGRALTFLWCAKFGRVPASRQKSESSQILRHTFVSRLANADVSADVRKALAKLSAIGGWR